MSEFQLVKEDEHAFTVKHPTGKHFQVAKAGLDKEVLQKIKAMTPIKLADGGIVPDGSNDPLSQIVGNGKQSYSTPAPNLTPDNVGDGYYRTPDASTDASRSPASLGSDIGSAIHNGFKSVMDWRNSVDAPVVQNVKDFGSALADGATPAQEAPSMTDAQSQAQQERQALSGGNGGPAPASTQTSQPVNYQLPPDMQKAYQMQMSGIQGNAQAGQQAGDQASKAWQDQNTAMQQQEQAYQARLKSIDDDQNQLMQKFSSQKIDPDRVWKTASTGSKIMAGIGLMLSGAGSASAGQENLAYNTIQKQIDRDIDAQKSDMGKTQSLFTMNMEKYKNAQLAEEATRLQMNTALNAKLESIKATTGSQQAKYNAQILQGNLQMQMAQQKHQMAILQMQAGVYGGASGQGGIPIGKEPAFMLMDEKYRQNRVPVGGVAYQAPNEKTADEMRKMEGAYQPIVDEIKLIQSLGADAAVPGSAANKRAVSAMARIGMKVNEFNGYNRFTDVDEKTIHNQFNDPSSIKSLFQGQGATFDTLRALKNTLENARSKNLIGYKGTADYQGRYAGNVNGR